MPQSVTHHTGLCVTHHSGSYLKPIYLISVFFFALLRIRCAANEDYIPFGYYEYQEFPALDGKGQATAFEWRLKRPIDLLAKLNVPKGERYFSVSNIHFRWVDASDIDSLMEKLNSTEPCAEVVCVYSSTLGGQSTVGREAAHLIVAYWKGYYPVVLNTGSLKTTNGEIVEWYKTWRKGQPSNSIKPSR